MKEYELYNKLLEAQNKDEGTFNAAVRNWIEGANEVHFEDEEANELFGKAKVCCAKWRNGSIDGRVSKQRMVEYVRQILKKNLPNPYKKPSELVVSEKDEQKTSFEATESKVKEQHDIQHVLGIVPDPVEKPRFFKNKKRDRDDS